MNESAGGTGQANDAEIVSISAADVATAPADAEEARLAEGRAIGRANVIADAEANLASANTKLERANAAVEAAQLSVDSAQTELDALKAEEV